MSDKPERAYAAARAMMMEETGQDLRYLEPRDPELQRWLNLGHVAIEAADKYVADLDLGAAP